MSKRFPHLDRANAWPGLDTVDPFDLQITFDPYLWTAGVELHLCRVRHDMQYRNIVSWPDTATRDAYYNSISDRSFVLETEVHIEPGQIIKLPVPLDVLQGYNFLFIDFPAPPVEYGEMSGDGAGVRYFYFIDGTSYRSPSTTAASIVMDQWTTHCTELDMGFIRLERGHAPLAATSAEWYLQNPMDRCEDLAIPDEAPSTGGSGRIKHTERIVVNAGDMLAVLIFDIDTHTWPGDIGADDWRTTQSNYLGIQGTYGITALAMAPGDVGPYLDRLYEHAPQLVPAIQSCFVINRSWIYITNTWDFWGVTVHDINAAQRVRDFLVLDRDQFGYPDRYKNLAKLYTSPYAWIEITNETGAVSRIRVEDTSGRLQLSIAASLAYPGIGIDACVLGIGDAGGYELGWNDFDGHAAAFAGDWTRIMRHWSIPTYLITQDPGRAYWYKNYWQIVQQQDVNATGEDLSYRTAAANYGMRIASIDRASARLSQQQSNDQAQLQLSQSTTQQSAEQSKTKIDRDHDADVTMLYALNSAQNQGLALASSQAAATGAQQQQAAKISQGLAIQNVEDVQVQGNYAVAAAELTGVMDTISAGASGFTNGMTEAGMAGAAVGGLENGISTGVNSGVNIAGAMISRDIANRQAVGAAQLSSLALEGAKLSTAQAQASYTLAASNNERLRRESELQMNAKRDTAKNFIDQQSRMMQSMQGNSLATQQAWQRAIQDGDNALGRAQAATTKGLSDASTAATKRLQDASVDRTARAAKLGTPVIITNSHNASTNTTMPMAMIATVRTLDAGAIAAAGDAFLTYGYRYGGREWRIRDLLPMTKFAYWEGDVQIGSNEVTMDTYETIRGIFEAGVFVWDREESIGATSIYDNARRSA